MEVGLTEAPRTISRVGPPTEVGLTEAPRTISRVPSALQLGFKRSLLPYGENDDFKVVPKNGTISID
jgi:hypothetical protein